MRVYHEVYHEVYRRVCHAEGTGRNKPRLLAGVYFVRLSVSDRLDIGNKLSVLDRG